MFKRLANNPRVSLICALVVTLGLETAFIGLRQMRFMEPDDLIITAMLGGAYGTGTQALEIPYISLFLTAPMLWIHKLTGSFLVYPIVMVCMYNLALFCLHLSAAKSTHPWVVHCVVISMSALMLMRFTYTVVAYALAFSGALLLSYQEKGFERILALCALVLGVLVRLQAGIAAIMLAAPALLITFKRDAKLVVSACAIVALAAIASWTSLGLFFQRNEAARSYITWNDASANVRDKLSVDYTTHKDVMDKLGWSENDYYMLNTWRFANLEVFSTEKLQAFTTELDPFERLITPPYWIYETGFKFMCAIFIATAVVVLILAKPVNVTEGIALAVAFCIPVFQIVLFLTIARCPPRLFVPTLALSVIQLVFLLASLKQRVEHGFIACIAIVIFALVPALFYRRYFLHYVSSYQRYAPAIQYEQEHQDYLFLTSPTHTNYLYLVVPLFELNRECFPTNVVDLGNWNSFNSLYYKRLASFEISPKEGDQLFELLVTHDNVRLITWADREDCAGIILQYLREHVSKDVSYTVEETIMNDAVPVAYIYEFSLDG